MYSGPTEFTRFLGGQLEMSYQCQDEGLDSDVTEFIFMNKVLQKKHRKNKEGSAVKIKKDPHAEEINSEEDEPPLPALY